MGDSFKVGDAVQFSHGGREMTVYEIDSLGVHCVWHNDHGGLERNVFPAAALRIASRPRSAAPIATR